MKRLSPKFEQFVIAFALCAAFLLMASVFAPDYTKAEPGTSATPEVMPPSTDAHLGLSSLGTLEDGRYIVQIYSGEDGPLYSVYDVESGEELAVLLTAEKAAEWFPDLPIPEMNFGTEGPIMLAEPAFMGDH